MILFISFGDKIFVLFMASWNSSVIYGKVDVDAVHSSWKVYSLLNKHFL